MKETILLTIAFFLISAPDPDSVLERDMPMQGLLPLLTHEEAQPVPMDEMGPVTIRGSVSAEWVFVDDVLDSADLVARVDGPHARAASTQSLN